MPELRAQLTRYGPDHRMPRHVDGHRRLSVLVAGGQEERERRAAETARVGSIALKAPEFPHRNEFGPAGALIVSVLLPDEALRELGHDPRWLCAWKWVHGGDATRAGLRLACGLRRQDGLAVEESLHELLARQFSGARRRGMAGGGGAGALPAPVRRVRDRLHEAALAPPSVARLAAAEGMHPVSLGRLFRRHLGCSITRYRQRLRAASAALGLLEGDETLSGVAYDHGFADLAHLSRVFRRELGAPPGRFRRTLRSEHDGLDSFKTEWSVTV